VIALSVSPASGATVASTWCRRTRRGSRAGVSRQAQSRLVPTPAEIADCRRSDRLLHRGRIPKGIPVPELTSLPSDRTEAERPLRRSVSCNRRWSVARVCARASGATTWRPVAESIAERDGIAIFSEQRDQGHRAAETQSQFRRGPVEASTAKVPGADCFVDSGFIATFSSRPRKVGGRTLAGPPV
jgi:hypothetical protein